MPVWLIDGSVEAVQSRRTRGKYTLYDSIRFKQRDGAEQTVMKVSAAGGVAKALQPGATGRFYLSRVVDQTGIHGLRLDNGVSAYDHFHNLELMLLIAVGGGFFMLVIGLSGVSGFMITPVIFGGLAALAYFFFRRARMEGRRQYDEDAIGAPSAPRRDS